MPMFSTCLNCAATVSHPPSWRRKFCNYTCREEYKAKQRAPRIAINQRFGHWTVTAPAQTIKHSGTRYYNWLCVCDCGTERVVHEDSLLEGSSTSCGCVHYNARKEGYGRPERGIWWSMIDRCSDERNRSYNRYGGRGIKVCERWMTFTHFLTDMGYRPSPDHSLDRIDVNGNYEPENCRWATRTQQQQNRRDTVKVSINGKTVSVAELAKQHKINYLTLRRRLLEFGLSLEEALAIPPGRRISRTLARTVRIRSR